MKTIIFSLCIIALSLAACPSDSTEVIFPSSITATIPDGVKIIPDDFPAPSLVLGSINNDNNTYSISFQSVPMAAGYRFFAITNIDHQIIPILKFSPLTQTATQPSGTNNTIRLSFSEFQSDVPFTQNFRFRFGVSAISYNGTYSEITWCDNEIYYEAP